MSSRSSGLFIVVAAVAVAAAALFASTRAKPPVIYAAGYGLLVGMILRLAAETLLVPRTWRLIAIAALLVGCGFVGSFVPSYRRARERELPSDPIAAALLRQAAANDPTLENPSQFSIATYLSRRLPEWPHPWPVVAFGAECLMAVLLGAGVMSVGSPRPVESKGNDENAPDVSVPELQ